MTARLAGLLLLAAAAAHAEPVAIKGGLGQGIIASHRGHCYLLFPAHVEPVAPIFSLNTAPPQQAGRATVYLRRSEADIGLALVEGSAAEACTTSLASLPREVSALLTANRTAILERVNPQGGIERLQMRIERTAWDAAADSGPSGLYQYIFAATDTAAGETGEVFQGTSGAFLYVEGVPVGMAVTSPDAHSVRALRIEEILGPADRWFATGSLAGRAVEGTEAAAAPAAAAKGLAFDVTEWSGTPAEGSLPTDLVGGGALRIAADGLPFAFVLELGPKALKVGSLFLSGEPPSAAGGPPRYLSVEVDRERGAARFEPAGDIAEMTRDGAPIEIPLNTFARRIRVTVSEGWSDGAPVGIAGVLVSPPD